MAQLSIIHIPFLLCVQLLHNFFAPLLCKAGKENTFKSSCLQGGGRGDGWKSFFLLYFFFRSLCVQKKALKFFQRRAKFNFTNRGNKVCSDDEGNHGFQRKKQKKVKRWWKNYLNSDPWSLKGMMRQQRSNSSTN